MKKIWNFIRENRLISSFFLISIFLIVAYILSMECQEWFDGAEKWFNLFFQLAIGYVINFMFYVTQVYIPNNKRTASVRKCIGLRIQNIANEMNHNFTALSKIYLNNHSGSEYTNEEFQIILNRLSFDDAVDVINICNNNNFTVKQWIGKCITQTENEINKLYTYYPNDISANLMKVLEEILKSTYHKAMPTLLASQRGVSFSQAEDCFFSEYYKLLLELKEIGKAEYNY